MASTECHHAQDGLRLLLLEPPQWWLVLNGLKIVTIETLSKVDSIECLHAQDSLEIVTSETLLPEIGLFLWS